MLIVRSLLAEKKGALTPRRYTFVLKSRLQSFRMLCPPPPDLRCATSTRCSSTLCFHSMRRRGLGRCCALNICVSLFSCSPPESQAWLACGRYRFHSYPSPLAFLEGGAIGLRCCPPLRAAVTTPQFQFTRFLW